MSRRMTPYEKQLRRRSDRRGCDGTDRSARRNEAKRLGYVWAALEHRRISVTGQIVVLLP